MLRTFLGEVFKFCIPKGLVRENFASGVIPKLRPKGRARANRPWTVEELDKVLSLAPAHVRVALALMANTGLDPSDALNLRRDKIDNGVIWAQRGKTGQDVPLPINDRLQAAPDAAPAHDAITVLATIKGTPWTYDGFATVWHRFRAKQVAAEEMPADLTLKGLRHTVATILREVGYQPRQIADYLGQKTESMAIHYSRDADMAERNRATVSLLDSEIERRTKVVKPFPKNVNS
jgi:integrase